MQANAYKLTTLSCFTGIFVQAIITNLTAILFIPLMRIYDLSYIHLGTLVAVNFSVQVGSDLVFSGLIDRIGFRRLVLPSCLLAFAGLALFALAPSLFPSNAFGGIIVATILFAASCGLLEVLLSPIVNAIPNADKGPAMSLLHSFYAWGQVATIVVTTLFLFVFGDRSWVIIALIWSAVPLANFFMFLKSPFPDSVPVEHRLNFRDLILQPFCLLAFAAIFFGAASEVVMNQWASAFMEKALLFPKVTGDLLGMCGFAVMLGVGRALYGKYGARLQINKVLVWTSLMAVVCYLVVALAPANGLSLAACILCGFAVSLLWPGTLITASERYPLAGAWLFALLAAAGDIGAAAGPWMTGWMVDNAIGSSLAAGMAGALQTTPEQAALRLGILAAVAFPVVALLTHLILKAMQHRHVAMLRAAPAPAIAVNLPEA
jgi:fucose permease